MKRICRHIRENALLSDGPQLGFSSLIDICFLLLIYFLVTTTIQPREKELRLNNLPTDVESLVSLPPMLIELRGSGEVVVNPGDAAEVYEAEVDSRDLPLLSKRLETLAIFGKEGLPKVLLQVDDEVQQQRYIDVINCLAKAGISDIAIID